MEIAVCLFIAGGAVSWEKEDLLGARPQQWRNIQDDIWLELRISRFVPSPNDSPNVQIPGDGHLERTYGLARNLSLTTQDFVKRCSTRSTLSTDRTVGPTSRTDPLQSLEQMAGT
jgi:hypothetical protein